MPKTSKSKRKNRDTIPPTPPVETSEPHELISGKIFISVKNLCKSFGTHEVIKNISLDIFEGETLSIIGTSGGGKSVFVKHLLGLLQPTSGSVNVEGADIASLNERALAKVRKKIGILFQNGALFDSMTVAQNVAFPLREAGLKDEKKIYDRVFKALDTVGLGEHLDKMPQDLSGGMRKRVALARAVIARPRCILYDEPTAGLDPVACDTIDQLILRLQKTLGVTSVVITHNMRSVRRISNRVAYFHKGGLYFLGSVDDLENSRDQVLLDFIEGRSREMLKH